jgi:hypothetical protein
LERLLCRDYDSFLADLAKPETFKLAEGKILVGKPWAYTGQRNLKGHYFQYYPLDSQSQKILQNTHGWSLNIL